MAILSDYENGNHRTMVFDDGTRFRETGAYVEGKWVADDADHFTFDFPESFDLKITDYCDGGCPWCHENSTVNGKHGDLSKLDHIIDTLTPVSKSQSVVAMPLLTQVCCASSRS